MATFSEAGVSEGALKKGAQPRHPFSGRPAIPDRRSGGDQTSFHARRAWKIHCILPTGRRAGGSAPDRGQLPAGAGLSIPGTRSSAAGFMGIEFRSAAS
jgi:hypothetical protein